jgi:hypothetical protein
VVYCVNCQCEVYYERIHVLLEELGIFQGHNHVLYLILLLPEEACSVSLKIEWHNYIQHVSDHACPQLVQGVGQSHWPIRNYVRFWSCVFVDEQPLYHSLSSLWV